ncbi:MAG: PAS domain-containing protein, partial [Methylocystis sp.]
MCETGNVQGLNAAAERLLGYKENELLGGPFHPYREIMRDGDASGNFLAKAINWRLMPSGRSTFRHKNGSMIEVVYTVHALAQDGAGSVLLIFHEREREPFEATALKDIETKLDVVFDAMPGGFVVIDEHGLIG